MIKQDRKVLEKKNAMVSMYTYMLYNRTQQLFSESWKQQNSQFSCLHYYVGEEIMIPSNDSLVTWNNN
jgi:hypothetical protein